MDNDMEEQFVPYELALKLKQLGFNEVCLANYNNLTDNTRLLLGKTDEGCITWNKTPDKYNAIIESNERILAPLWQQAFDWFKTDKNLYADIYRTGKLFSANIEDILMGNSLCEVCKEINYEEARLKCLEKLIEIISN